MSSQPKKEKKAQQENIDRDFAIGLAAPSDLKNRMPDRPLPRSLLLGINLGLHGSGGSGTTTTTTGGGGSTILNGADDPVAADGADGDLFFQTASNHLWRKIGELWSDLGNFIGINGTDGADGAAGDAGADGDDGDDGVNGLNVYGEDRVPTAADGVNGEHWLHTGTQQFFEKVNDAWNEIFNIQGAAGDAGANGDDGADGANGTNGLNVYGEDRVPTAADGVVGEHWLDTSTQNFFEKLNSGWNQIFNIQGEDGVDGLGAVTSDLGNIPGSHNVDLDTHSNRQLFGNITGNATITFTNIPNDFELTMRLYIKTANPTVTIGGNALSDEGVGTLEIGDYLDVVISSNNQTTISIVNVKKNDLDIIAPSVPTGFTFEGKSHEAIDATWGIPEEGSLPITFDLAYSESISEDSNGAPNAADVVTITDLESVSRTITGLDSFTTYYGWIRAKNDVGESNWVGPSQANTDPPITNTLLNLIMRAISYNTITGSWTTPDDRNYTYTVDVTSPFVQSVVIRSIVQEFRIQFLDPNTDHTIRLRVFNEVGTVIFEISTIVTTDELPVVESNDVDVTVDGTRMEVEVTFPVGISICQIEWDLVDSFDHRLVTRTFNLPFDATTRTATYERQLTPATIYYVRVAFVYNGVLGDYSDTFTITTGTLLPPVQPNIIGASPDTGEVRLTIQFRDDESVQETAVVTYRIASTVGPFTSFESYSRDNPPADDGDDREDRIEVIRGGFTPGEDYTFRVIAVNSSGASPPDSINIDIDE